MWGIAAALLLNFLMVGFALSLWMEQGPYHWAAAAQFRMMETYSQKITMLVTVCFFSFFAIFLLKPILRSGRWVRTLAFGPIILLGIVHFSLSVYFFATGGSPSKELRLVEAVQTATLLPHSVLMKKGELDGLNYSYATHIARQTNRISQSSPKYNGSHFILIETSDAAVFPLPVVMKSSGSMLDQMAEDTHVDGLIYRAPFPFLLRQEWGDRAANYGVIFSNGESVREYWSVIVMMYAILIVVCLLGLFSRWRNNRARFVG